MISTNMTELSNMRMDEVICEYLGGGNLARKLNISHPAISKWNKIPAFRAYQISKFGDFTSEYIRPDLPKGFSKIFAAIEDTLELIDEDFSEYKVVITKEKKVGVTLEW